MVTTDQIAGTRTGFGRYTEELVDSIREAANVVLAQHPIDTELEAAEAARYLARLVAAGSMIEVENHDPAYPHLTQIESPWMQWATLNPDCCYLHAPLDGQYEYRLFGRRGSAHNFDVEIYGGDNAQVADLKVCGGRDHRLDGTGTLAVGAGGEIEIVLSAKEQPGNWIAIPPGPSFVAVRQYFYDWDNEEPADLFIERIGATYPPPAPTAEQYAERLDLLNQWLRFTTMGWAHGIKRCLSAPGGSVPFPPMTLGKDRDHGDQIGFRGLYYGQGHFRCQPDEAVILEVKPPACTYWSFHLTNIHWESLDWVVRQTSLNGHQAVLDDDGVFRAVIAQRDPGVPNWLDAADHTTGLITGRYLSPDSVPEAALTMVPFDQVRAHLPELTPVISAQDRSETLRQRMHSVRRRRCD